MAVAIRGHRSRILAAGAAVALACTACGAAGGSNTLSLTMYNGASGQFTDNFNPFTPTTNSATRGMIYETLLFFNQGRADDIQNMLATGYQWSNGGRTVTFSLRDGVKWSDGKPFTSDDVAFTFDLMRTNPKLNSFSLPLAGVRATDPTHVSIDFTKPAYTDLWFVAGQSFILPRHLWSGLTTDLSTYANSKPVGTGPFTLRSFSAQSYVVAKNPHYWQPGKPAVDTIRFVSYSGNQSALNALLAGQLDWSSLFIPNIDRTYAAKNQQNKYINTPQFITNLTANLDKGPTSDLAVRQAIYYGIDRDQVNKVAFSGYDTPATTGELLLPRDQKWLAADLRGTTPTYDPARAERSLRGAGYTKGTDGFYRDRNGQRLRIGIKVVTGYTDFIAALQVITQQLAKIGIDARAQEQSFAAFSADQHNGNFDLLIDNLYGGPTPYYLYNNFYNSKSTAPVGTPTPSNNYARFRSSTVDSALATIAASQDDATQQRAYAQIQHEITAALPYIPIMQSSTLTQYRTSKVTGWPTTGNLYALPMAFQSPDIGVVTANLRAAR